MTAYYLLFALYCLIFVYIICKNKQDSFSPPILFCTTMSFYTLPDMYSIGSMGVDKFVSELPFKIAGDPYWSVCRMMIIQILFVLSYYVFYKQNVRRRETSSKKNVFTADNANLNLMFGLSILSLCIFGTWNFFMKNGGIMGVMASFTDRDQLVEDAGFLFLIIPSLITFACAFILKYCSQKSGRHLILLSLLILIGFFSLTSGGGRSAFVVFILSLLCYYNVWIKKINLFSIRFAPVYIGLALFIIVFQLLRFEDSNDLSAVNELADSDALFNSMAYVKTQLLIQNYFEDHDFWFGRVFTFLLYIFIPRSIFPNKPHIDEGVYIFNMMNNPQDALAANYYYCSWPPFTSGISYANFGIVGVLLGGALLGYLHAYVHKKVINNPRSFISLVIYIFVVLKFQFTVFYIANLSYLVVQCYLFKWVYKLLNNKNTLQISNKS